MSFGIDFDRTDAVFVCQLIIIDDQLNEVKSEIENMISKETLERLFSF